MLLTIDQQERVEELSLLSEAIEQFMDPKFTIRGDDMIDIAGQLIKLFDRYELNYASKFLEVTVQKDKYYYRERLSSIKDEINYVIELAIAQEDPSYQFKLFSKKISDMTGFEYQRYLILSKENSETIRACLGIKFGKLDRFVAE